MLIISDNPGVSLSSMWVHYFTYSNLGCILFSSDMLFLLKTPCWSWSCFWYKCCKKSQSLHTHWSKDLFGTLSSPATSRNGDSSNSGDVCLCSTKHWSNSEFYDDFQRFNSPAVLAWCQNRTITWPIFPFAECLFPQYRGAYSPHMRGQERHSSMHFSGCVHSPLKSISSATADGAGRAHNAQLRSLIFTDCPTAIIIVPRHQCRYIIS